jgi:guanylate kinase
MENAKKEMEYGLSEGNFDVVIVNNDLDTTYIELEKSLKSMFPELFTNKDLTN